MAKLVFAAIIILVLVAYDVSALGVTPSRVILRFEPNGVYNGGACFKTYGIETLKIEKDGDFASNIEFIGLDPSWILDASINPCIQYKLTLPAKVEKPGMHYTHVNALELPDEAQGNIFAVVRIQHQIWVEVPYPGKYLEIKSFTGQNSKAGDVVPLTVMVENKGVELITGASGSIDIFSNDGARLATLQTNILGAIAPAESKKLSANWNSSGNREGNYRAEFTLIYDSLRNNATTKFKLGGLDVSLVDYTKQVYIGGIRQYQVTADSIWSEPIPNVKATVEVYNDSVKLTSFETLTRTFPPWGTESMPGFIDTDLLGLGNFSVKINLSYENISKIYDGRLEVTEKPAPVIAQENKPSLFNTKYLLIGMGLTLIIVVIILIIALLPKKRKEEGLNKEKQAKSIDEKSG